MASFRLWWRRQLLPLVLVLFCIFVFENTQAEPEVQSANPSQDLKTPQDFFQAGLKAYQNKNFQQALQMFQETLRQTPENAAVLTNLGLSSFQLNHKPWAIAYFRKALALEPSFEAAQDGLRVALSQLEIKEIPHKIETYELLRDYFLASTRLSAYFFLVAVTAFLFGWSLIRYLGLRKRALEEEAPYPVLPWSMFVASLLFVAFFSLGVLKTYDNQIPRATVIEDKVAAQSIPGENQLGLFELHGGFEVIVQASKDDWVQVTYPGAMTGWIKKTSIFVTSGGTPW